MSTKTTKPTATATSETPAKAGTSKSTSKEGARSNGRPRVPGVIEPGCLLTAEEAQARLRLGSWGWRTLRRRGLRTLRVGNRSYVLSEDLISLCRHIAEGENQ